MEKCYSTQRISWNLVNPNRFDVLNKTKNPYCHCLGYLFVSHTKIVLILGDDLNRGKTKLDLLVKSIENNLVELSKCQDKIKNKDSQLKEHLAKLESSSERPNIDEYFGPVQPLYKQLLNAFVEENSIVDTTYYLSEALQKGVIDLDVFIKVIITA